MEQSALAECQDNQTATMGTFSKTTRATNARRETTAEQDKWLDNALPDSIVTQQIQQLCQILLVMSALLVSTALKDQRARYPVRQKG
jgi:hypothetical protein